MNNQTTTNPEDERQPRENTEQVIAECVESMQKSGIPAFEISAFQRRIAARSDFNTRDIFKEAGKVIDEYEATSQSQEALSAIEAPEEPEVDFDKMKKFIAWAKNQALKEAQQEITTEDVIDQLLLLGKSEEQAQSSVKKWLKSFKDKEKQEKFLVRVKEWMAKAGIWRAPDLGSFAWHNAMARMLDERLQEFDAVEFDTSIKMKLYDRAIEMGDELNAQLYLMSLAKAGEFYQGRIDRYFETFCRKRTADPKNFGAKIPLPNPQQFWFEQKVRKLAKKEGGTFSVSKNTRYKVVWEGGSIKIEPRNRKEMYMFADITATEVGGRRSPNVVAPDVFIHNLIEGPADKPGTVAAINKMLEEKYKVWLPQDIRAIETEIKIRRVALLEARYRGDRKDMQRLEGAIEQLISRQDNLKAQRRIIAETVGKDDQFYKKGELKPMLLDPFSERTVSIKVKGKEVIFAEKDLAMDIGLIKFLTTKSAADTRYTIEGEHVSYVDMDAFRQMMSLRRREEYRWAASHPEIGSRTLPNETYGIQKDGYQNLINALEEPKEYDPRYKDFALRSQGFFLDLYEEVPRQRNLWIIAPSLDNPAVMVAVMPATPAIRKHYRDHGYYNPDISIIDRDEDFRNRIREAEQAGRVLQKEVEAIKPEIILGTTGEGILASMKSAEDEEEYELSRQSTTKAIHTLLEKAHQINLGEILEPKKDGDDQDIFGVFSNAPLYINRVANAEAKSRHLSPQLVSAIEQVFEKRVRRFRADNLNEAYQRFSQLSADEKLSYPYPQVEYEELLIAEELKNYHTELEKEKSAVEPLLKQLNKDLKQICQLLILSRGVKKEVIDKVQKTTTRAGQPIDFAQLDLPEKSGIAQVAGKKLSIARNLKDRYRELFSQYASLEDHKLGSGPREQGKKEIEDLKTIFGKDDQRIEKDQPLTREILEELQCFQLAYQAIQQKLQSEIKTETSLQNKEEEVGTDIGVSQNAPIPPHS